MVCRMVYALVACRMVYALVACRKVCALVACRKVCALEALSAGDPKVCMSDVVLEYYCRMDHLASALAK